MIHLPRNSGGRPGLVRNVGVRVATGDYVAFLDDDDRWVPNKLEKQLLAMSRSGALMCCSSAAYVTDGDEDLTRDVPSLYENLPNVLTASDVADRNKIVSSSVIVSRRVLEKVNGLFSGSTFAEDYGLWKRCLRHTNCACVPETMVLLGRSRGDDDRATTRSIRASAIGAISREHCDGNKKIHSTLESFLSL